MSCNILFVQQLVHSGIVSIHKVGTVDNLVDIFTKYVGADTLKRRLYGVGLHCQH